MGLVTIDLNNINFDDDNFDGDDPESIIHVRLRTWCNRFIRCKADKRITHKRLVILAHFSSFCSLSQK